jgi:hypothetical protein
MMGHPPRTHDWSAVLPRFYLLVRPYNRLLPFRSLRTGSLTRATRTALRLAVACAFVFLSPPGRAGAQFTTRNQFVGAKVEQGGYLTIYKGDPANNERLTFYDKSYLTVKVDGKYYSNNPDGGKIGNGTALPIDDHMLNGQNSQIGDTLRTVWPESGFDIVQDAFPVAFSNSGVIVISIKIVNRLITFLNVQAQYLLDNQNSSNSVGLANDNPYLIDRYGYFRNWQDCPPSPLPSFFLAFQLPPASAKLGTVGIGYVNNEFPPRPLGLLPLSFLEFGNWPNQEEYTWGPPGLATDRINFNDEAALLMGQPMGASGFTQGSSEYVTEIMRTAYGTPEWCYVHGNIVGFSLYPQHLIWNSKFRTYTPNPFQVETFLFNVTPSTASNVMIRQTVGDPIRIVSPKPTGLPKDTTQLQNAGSISGWDPLSSGGVADVRWTDSVTVLPSGCAASFPVDIHFDVTAGGIDTPIFTQPWVCSIAVDCANPDTIPPAFLNTFTGCDSIMHDTVTVQDNAPFDLGLKDITYTSNDLTPAQYSVTINPKPPFQCIHTPVKIYVQQVDTFQRGHVIFTFTDCANNVSKDTVCFTAHSPLPDLTAPRIWLDSSVADCHAQCRKLDVTDTVTTTKSIDRGVYSIDTVSNSNMTLSGVPSGGTYPLGTPIATIHVCVTDSMRDGKIILRVTDTAHNVRFDTISYCTTPDILAPVVAQQATNPAGSAWHVHITETQAWDRGIDSVWVDQASNISIVPAPFPNPLGCRRTYDFDVHVTDTTECGNVTIHTRDCAGNISIPVKLAFSKSAKPVILASKTVLCSDTDSAVLDAGANYSSYLWSTGETTRKIVVHKAGFYFVTVGEGVGCSSTSDPDTITSSPATPHIVPPGPITLCAPADTLLDAGVGYVKYQWFKDASPIAGEIQRTTRARVSGTYTAQVTNAAGCSGTSQWVSVTIDTVPRPVIDTVNNVMTSTPAASYQWSRNDTPISNAKSQSYTDLTGGSYTVTITDANGCSSTSLPVSNAGSTLIAVPSMIVAHESDHVTIPLSIVTSQSLPQGINRTFTAVLRFNKTLLVPDGLGTIIGTQGDYLVVQYTGTSTSTQGVLANLPFIAALGDSVCTTVTIDTFYWSTPNISVTRQNGQFCLSGLCTQGGTRLFNPEGKVTMSVARPNPTSKNIQIDYELIEPGPTTLVIYNLLGREVLRLVDGDQKPGTYTIDADVSMLPAGTYVYSLRTPTIVKSNHLQIAR